MRFSAEGLIYAEACKLINALKASGIEACIGTGAVAVYPEEGQILLAERICKEHGASFDPGSSTIVQMQTKSRIGIYWEEESVKKSTSEYLKEKGEKDED